MVFFVAPFLKMLIILNTILFLMSPSSLNKLFSINLRDVFAINDIHMSDIHISGHEDSFIPSRQSDINLFGVTDTMRKPHI